jgi:hypothetical protein
MVRCVRSPGVMGGMEQTLFPLWPVGLTAECGEEVGSDNEDSFIPGFDGQRPSGQSQRPLSGKALVQVSSEGLWKPQESLRGVTTERNMKMEQHQMNGQEMVHKSGRFPR